MRSSTILHHRGVGHFQSPSGLPLSRSARLLPKLTGDLDWVDASGLPPSPFIAGSLCDAMMDATEWDSEFIACLSTQRERLHVAEVMGVRRPAAADQTRLFHDIANVLAVAIAPRSRYCEHAFVYSDGLMRVGRFVGGSLLLLVNRSDRRIVLRNCQSFS